MAMYVYRDKERKDVLCAQKALTEDKNTRFYCPNPDCDAHMYVCGIDGASAAYFSATYPKYPHKEDCSFGSSNSFHSVNHDEDSFDFEKAVESMTAPSKLVKKTVTPNSHRTGTPGKKPLRTIRQIYDMCKAYKCSDTYNNVEIGKMLLDDRSVCMYPTGIFGHKLIEAKTKKGYFYNSETMTICLYTPLKNKKYQLQLIFETRELFKIVKDELFNNQDKIVLVAGNWGKSATSNVFYTKITSKKQYHVIVR